MRGIDKIYGLCVCVCNGLILTIKAKEMHYLSNFFLVKNSTCFGHIYCPSSGVPTLYSQ